MPLSITPLRNLVLVRVEEEPEAPSGAIQVVRTDGRPPSCFATVLALGPDVRDAQVGAPVVISRLQGVEVAGGLLIPEDAILASREDDFPLGQWKVSISRPEGPIKHQGFDSAGNYHTLYENGAESVLSAELLADDAALRGSDGI